MTTPATRLRLHSGRTTLADGGAPEVAIGVGAQQLAEQHFRHDLPQPIEIERAIDVVEEALAATGLAHAERGELLIADPVLLAPLGLGTEGMRLTRDEVEERFERLATAALGHPGALAGMPLDRVGAVALLLLRECMHHLGYASVRWVAG